MKTYIVSAFTTEPFSGNPAAVCILDGVRSDAELQAIAAELNQPVTAFLAGSGEEWNIRWFTPSVAVDLCGHATLAAAFTIWSERKVASQLPLKFYACDRQLSAFPISGSRVLLDFPASFGHAAEADEELVAAAGRAPIGSARHGDRWIFEYSSAAEVRKLRPNFDRLRDTAVRSLIVTALSDDSKFDIISRNFAPLIGINEDHVTGMAHTCVATYWHPRLGGMLRCWQASSRGGAMITKLVKNRVLIEGSARMELSGNWLD